MRNTLTDYWNDVESYVQEARLIAWDTCHKIYLAMDEYEEQWFRDNYAPNYFQGTPDEMLKKLHEWYDDSCGLRFISAVEHNADDPNAGFTDLIPQGADYYEDEDEPIDW